MLPLLGAIATAGAAHHGHRVLHLLQRVRHPGTLLFDFLQGLCSHMQVLCKILWFFSLSLSKMERSRQRACFPVKVNAALCAL